MLMESIKVHYSLSMITLAIDHRKTKVASSFSAYLGIIYGVPQESILGSVLFSIDLCGLFFEDYSSDVASFVNDNTFYGCGP